MDTIFNIFIRRDGEKERCLGKVRVKDKNNTYLAQFNGSRASCTAGPSLAANAVLRKTLSPDDLENVYLVMVKQ